MVPKVNLVQVHAHGTGFVYMVLVSLSQSGWFVISVNWIFSVSFGRHVRSRNRLVGLVVKASASRAEDPGFESRLRRDFFGAESYQ